MKVSILCGLAGLCLLVSCSKTTSSDIPEIPELNEETQYAVVLNKSGSLEVEEFQADGKTIDYYKTNTEFGSSAFPILKARTSNSYVILSSGDDCNGKLKVYDRNGNKTYEAFPLIDAPTCDQKINAVAHWGDKAFVAYEQPGDLEKEKYYTLLESVMDGDGERTLALDDKPVQILVSASKVYLLTLDEFGTEKFALSVIDRSTLEENSKINLDFDVLGMTWSPEGTILIGYEAMHVVVDPATTSIVSTVRYTEGKAPRFAEASDLMTGEEGLYYPYNTEMVNSSVPYIPAVYKIAEKTLVLFYYENFLTEDERSTDYDIGSTTVVGFDAANKIIVVGYERASDPSKGGILRIKTEPELKFVDQIYLEGVPLVLFPNP